MFVPYLTLTRSTSFGCEERNQPTLHTINLFIMSNFAPYQDADPSEHRAASPAPPHAPPPQNDRLPSPTSFEAPRPTGFGNELGADERNVDVYSTSLPIRPDIEAVLAYVALPPAGPALLLIFETSSDYVRFHAWQSALVYTLLFVTHLIFSFTKTVSLILLVVDLVLMAWLGGKAYQDGRLIHQRSLQETVILTVNYKANSLERFELPYVGRLASSFVDAE